jgi:fatty acid amide hydrolase 2
MQMLSLSAVELASRIRRRELCSVEVVAAHIARVRQVNPLLNAMVAERFEHAMAEAHEADVALDRGADVGPLHGVPCSIKECFALTGMPQSAGLVARRDFRASSDATAVARLRAAGAIPLGVTNTSELCMWMESSNRLYGRTGNPYDPRCIVGGSSGGEAAVVASGGAPFGLGSDIGGSIRMPAFFCGVFGHKPTGGLVPGTGQYPPAHGDGRRMLTTGPICRRAGDLWPLMRVLAGPDGHDDCAPLPLGDPDAVRLDRLRVFVVDGNGLRAVDGELLVAQGDAAEWLRQSGAKVERLALPELAQSLTWWSTRMQTAGGQPFRALLGEGTPIPLGQAWLDWLAGRSPHTMPALALASIEHLPGLAPADPEPIVAEARAFSARLTELLGDDGVLLYPPYTRPAPHHDVPKRLPIDWLYTAVWNALELPVSQVPLGLGEAGLPLGVQVVAGHGQDHVAVAVAQALERAAGGWVWPRAV